MIRKNGKVYEHIPQGKYCSDYCSWFERDHTGQRSCGKYLKQLYSTGSKLFECADGEIPFHWADKIWPSRSKIEHNRGLCNPELLLEYRIGAVVYEKYNTENGIEYYKATISDDPEKQNDGIMDRVKMSEKLWEKEISTKNKHMSFSRRGESARVKGEGEKYESII